MHISHWWDNVYIILCPLFSVNYSFVKSQEVMGASNMHKYPYMQHKDYREFISPLFPFHPTQSNWSEQAGVLLHPTFSSLMQTNGHSKAEFLLFCFKSEIGVQLISLQLAFSLNNPSGTPSRSVDTYLTCFSYKCIIFQDMNVFQFIQPLPCWWPFQFFSWFSFATIQ